jgi:hypothetical protein
MKTNQKTSQEIIGKVAQAQEVSDKVAPARDRVRMTDRKTDVNTPRETTGSLTVQVVDPQTTIIHEMIESQLVRQEIKVVTGQTIGQTQKTRQLRHGKINTCHAHRNLCNPRFQ